jgi:hypothetical protein
MDKSGWPVLHTNRKQGNNLDMKKQPRQNSFEDQPSFLRNVL